MSYKCKLTFLRTQDSTTKSDFEINYSFSYHLGQEETYKGEEKKSINKKTLFVKFQTEFVLLHKKPQH